MFGGIELFEDNFPNKKFAARLSVLYEQSH